MVLVLLRSLKNKLASVDPILTPVGQMKLRLKHRKHSGTIFTCRKFGRCPPLILLIVILFGTYFYMQSKNLDWDNVNIISVEHLPIGNYEKGCKIPKLTPHTVIMDELHKQQALRYHDRPPCVKNYAAKFYIDPDSNLVRIWWTKNNTSNAKFWGMAACYFHTYRRDLSQPEFEYINGLVHEITENSTQLPHNRAEDGEFVSVWCYDKSSILLTPVLTLGKNRSWIIYEDHLVHIPILKSKRLVKERKSRFGQHGPKNGGKNGSLDAMSIIVLGIDTTSRMNFMRFMPKSYRFLQNELKAVDFVSFNTMGYNTYDSIMPILTGHSQRELRVDYCRWYMIGLAPLDNCPFIWKEAKRRGYISSFYDEELDRGLRPFRRPPRFDFDFRNFVRRQKVDAVVGQGTWEQTAFECIGSRLTFDVNLDIILKMAHRFRDSGLPFFHFGWTQQLTHVLNKFTKYGDDPLLEFLRRMKTEGFLDNTALIIVGDHGRREEEPRAGSIQGFFEERLPILNIVLPDRLRLLYPEATKNLAENAQKLTTALDVHETLWDLFNISRLQDGKILQRTSRIETEAGKSGKKGISLFLPILTQRDCHHLSPQVDQSLCACLPKSKTIPVHDHVVKMAANQLVKEVNRRLAPYRQCQQPWAVRDISEAKVYPNLIENDSRTLVYRLKNWWDGDRTGFVRIARDLYEIKVVVMTATGGGGGGSDNVTFSAYLMQLVERQEGAWDILDLKRVRSHGDKVERVNFCGVEVEEVTPFCTCLPPPA